MLRERVAQPFSTVPWMWAQNNWCL